MSRNYSQTYRLVCQSIQDWVQERLGRPLTAIERNGIWNAGSLMMLESVERTLEAAQSIPLLETELANLSVTFNERFQSGVEKLGEELIELLSRPLSIEEHQAINNVATLYEAMRVVDWLRESNASNRASVFQQWLRDISKG
jgi:hypothetical protein